MRARWIRAAAAAAISAVAIAALVPRLTHTPWRAISSAWGELTWWKLALLSLLWAAGLLAYSTVLMGAMPGLTRRRAMTLNLTGSAVSNVLPLGGGLGVGLNYVMARSWGFSSGQFSLFTVLSNVWTVVAKAALPCLAVALLIARGVSIDQRILVWAVVGSAVLALTTGVALAIASSDRGARFAGRAAHLLPRFGRSRPDGAQVERRLIALRHSGAVIVRASWRRMTLGMVTYYTLGALLLWASLHVVGSTLGPVAVLALFAFERALTTLPITPGGSGVAEVATTALAIALSGPQDRAVVAAGVLLYRAFTFGLEIPVGGMWLLGWLLLQRAGRRPDVARLPVALGEAA
jgi:putative heme transporter